MSYIKSRKHAIAPLTRPVRAAALASLVAPGAVLAQQILPPVEVHGSPMNTYRSERSANPKVSRPLSETPQTITVIRKEVLQEQQARTLAEALRNTPGVTMLMGENGNTATGDAIFMRGVDTQGSIFVDGIRDLGTYSRDIYNIEQVEVVKGPAGADIGRGAQSGYVNLTTKMPSQEDFSQATLSVGTGVFARATADLNRTLSKDGSTAFRLNLMKQGGGVPGRDEVKDDGWAVAPALALGLGSATRVYLYAQHLDRDRRPDGGLPTVGLPGYYAAALGDIRPDKVDTSNYYGSRSDRDRVKVDMFTARIEHDLSPGVILRNSTRYGRAEQNLALTGVFNAAFATPTDPASYTVALLRQGKLQRNEILTNQTSVSSDFKTGTLRHTLVGGIELMYEKQNNYARAVVGTQTPQNLYDPSTSIAFAPIAPSGASTRGQTTTVAGYVSDTVDVTDRIQVGAGLRLDRYRTEYLSIPATTAESQAATNLAKSDLLKTWRLSGLYKLTDTGNVYAAYGSAEKPPGADNFTLNAGAANATTGLINANTPNLDPQKTNSLELGTKWDVLAKRLSLTAALFRTVIENDLAQVDAVTGAITQFGKRRIQGLELGASGAISENWQVMAGLARMDTKITQTASTTPEQQGAMVNWSPKLTLTAWTTYRLGGTGLTIGGGARHMSVQKRQVNSRPLEDRTAAQRNMPEVPSYTVFDAMVNYDISRNVGLQLNLYNLTDKFYLASMNNAGNRYTLGTPRTVMLTASLRF